jgi:hypothetical protein
MSIPTPPFGNIDMKQQFAPGSNIGESMAPAKVDDVG